MPITLEDLVMLQPPTPERPLLGSMVLVVEDSRHACEALRLICQRSGARIRRAESLKSAARHLRSYRPRIAVVDLGLPDGSGLELIEWLASADPRIDAIVATSGNDTLQEAAMDAGADLFLAKPIVSVSQFQNAVLSLLSEETRLPIAPRPSHDHVQPDPIALRDDLALAADLLRTGVDQNTFEYVANFLAGLAKSAGRAGIERLAETAWSLAQAPGQTNAASRLVRAIDGERLALEPV